MMGKLNLKLLLPHAYLKGWIKFCLNDPGIILVS